MFKILRISVSKRNGSAGEQFLSQMHTTFASLGECQRRPAEDEAWTRFVQLRTPQLFYWARRTGLPPQDAGDRVQEVLTVLLQKVPEFRSGRWQLQAGQYLSSRCEHLLHGHGRLERRRQARSGTCLSGGLSARRVVGLGRRFLFRGQGIPWLCGRKRCAGLARFPFSPTSRQETCRPLVLPTRTVWRNELAVRRGSGAITTSRKHLSHPTHAAALSSPGTRRHLLDHLTPAHLCQCLDHCPQRS